jgi:adenylosuccinate lyase
MTRVWSDENRLRLMLEVEKAFLEAISADKKIPESEIKAFIAALEGGLAQEAHAREKKSAHEVVAILEAALDKIRTKAPNVARYLHFGLTSSDVLDTALALQLKESSDLILAGLEDVRRVLSRLARKHRGTWMAGRTHGVHAEPISFGVKIAGWHAEALRNIERLKRARDVVSYGKLSGAVGAFTQMGPSFEAAVCEKLGLRPEPVSTQVVPRDRHADFFHAIVLSAAAIERWAVEIRHLQKTEVLELEEPFFEGQKGSSAMPHKRNPVLCENLCGLSRLIRSYETAVVENIILWHERDISHSSVERVVFPDALILLDFMLARFKSVLEGLTVNARRMRENLDLTKGMVFSQSVLLRLIDSGLERDKAYGIVQKNAMKCWKTGQPFAELLAKDPAVSRRLSAKELSACFDLKSYGASAAELLRRGGV